MSVLTMKFGGSAVGTTTALTQVVSIMLQASEHWDHLIVVASALEGVTDALVEAVHLAHLSNRRGYRRIVARIRTRHLALIEQLPLNVGERSSLQADIDRLLFDMLDVCQALSDAAVEDTIAPRTMDAIISVGERLSVRIIAALLRNSGLRSVALDTIGIVITDAQFGSATPELDATRLRYEQYVPPLLERNIIPVLSGFIGSTPDGRVTTLGRGGSDYTAAIIATCSYSDEMWMWADVDGMMSADPHELPDARIIPELSYEEIAEMAYFGARIVQTRMIGLVQEQSIPVRIKNVYKPQHAGTLVTGKVRPLAKIKAVTSIQGVALHANHGGSLAGVYSVLDAIVKAATGFPANVTITAQSSSARFVCVVIPPSAGPDAVGAAEAAFNQEIDVGRLELRGWSVMPVTVITVIGAALMNRPEVAAQIFDAMKDIPILAVSQGPSSCNLSLVVDPENAFSSLERIHALIV